MASVDWRPWRADAFARAWTEDKPVLLSIAVTWCESCLEMDRTTYADPEVVQRVNERFVPIRVDADRRPDISERYTLGGWPTTAFLTAAGEVIGGGTFVPLPRMTAILDRVQEAFESRRDELAASKLNRPRVGASRPDARERELEAIVFDTFDREHGGFGTAPKFPLTAPLDLALELYRESTDHGMAHIVEASLDAMGWGGLYDDVDGGFFRCADTRDWQAPRREKLLDVNASLLKTYLDASETLSAARYRERAEEVLRYVQTWLADPVDGGWGGSQRADRAYYAPDADARRGHAAPGVDGVLYTNWNAAMVSSALRAAERMEDDALGAFALKSLERILTTCYRPGDGVAHYLEGGPHVRGLLDDQIAMIAANLDAHAATGNVVYEMMAQELAHYAIRTMWDDIDGGFFDRATVHESERIGRMNERLKPFVANCEAARALKRLARIPGDHDFGVRADATLASMAPFAAGQGPLAAYYVLALRESHSRA